MFFHITRRLEAIAIRLEAIAIRLENSDQEPFFLLRSFFQIEGGEKLSFHSSSAPCTSEARRAPVQGYECRDFRCDLDVTSVQNTFVEIQPMP